MSNKPGYTDNTKKKTKQKPDAQSAEQIWNPPHSYNSPETR